MLLPEKLIIDSESGRVIDCNAAVLEEFCRRFHLEARTSLLWNLRQMKRGFVTEIFSPDHPNFKTVTVYSESLLLPESHFSKDSLTTDRETETGENAINAAASEKDVAVSDVEHAGQSLTEETKKDFADANEISGKKILRSNESVESSRDDYDAGWPQHPDIALLRKSICHDRLETFVFPFDLNILTGKQRDVVLPGCEIPLGGLYLHYFSVYCPETWQLCYEFPEETDLEHAGIRLVNLLAGSSVSYELKGSTLTVRILPDEYHRSAFLLTADHLMIPQSAYAQIEGFLTKKIDFSE